MHEMKYMIKVFFFKLYMICFFILKHFRRYFTTITIRIIHYAADKNTIYKLDSNIMMYQAETSEIH